MRRAVTLASAALLLAAALTVTQATAKGGYESPYGFERTWNAALRLVRVDLGLKVTEKDDANGYLLFEYTSPESGPKPVPASIEFIKGHDAEVRVVVQIARMPGYHEQVLVDALARKLRADYGDPPKRPTGGPEGKKDAGPDAETK